LPLVWAPKTSFDRMASTGRLWRWPVDATTDSSSLAESGGRVGAGDGRSEFGEGRCVCGVLLSGLAEYGAADSDGTFVERAGFETVFYSAQAHDDEDDDLWLDGLTVVHEWVGNVVGDGEDGDGDEVSDGCGGIAAPPVFCPKQHE